VNTYAMQLLLHYQAASTEDARWDGFLKDVRALAERHGLSVDDYQACRLNGEEYRIAPCAECGHLTVNCEDVRDGIEKMLPDFWFYVRRGHVGGGKAICELCVQSEPAA